jgi:Protein of unknown function (DUF3592)
MSNVEDWDRRHALPPALSYVLIGAALVLGFGFLGGAISQLWSSHKSKSWAQTQGVISESKWVPNHLQHGEGTAQIAYRYSVGGQSYEGTNILPGLNEYLTPDKQAKLRQYPVGATVTVFYDPTDPQNSSLEIGVITELTFIMFGLAIFFLLGAGAFIWRMRKGRPIPFTRGGTEPPPIIEDYKLFPKDK